MKKLKVEDLKNELYFEDIGNEFNDLEEILKFYMYNYISNDLEISEITEEQNDELLKWDFNDDNEQLENLIEYINKVLEVEV